MLDVAKKPITRIEEFFQAHYDFMDKKETWIFRGQKNDWDLGTKLEREIKRFKLKMKDAPKIEAGLLRRFKRQSHHYLARTPSPGNYMEWFALMRHYGAPTRLLDWTYSFFVAAYFAVENAEAKDDCIIWAFNAESMKDKLKRILPAKSWLLTYQRDSNLQLHRDFESIFMSKSPTPFICPMNPYEFNERLVVQQGVFLCPSDVSKAFEYNLRKPFSKAGLRKNLFKYTVTDNTELRKDILRHLHRMNMNRATLFPGLQGFAESLTTLLAFRDVPKVLPADPDYVKRNLWC